MKKVLIVIYNYSQTESIASIRIRGLAKYLPAYGWQPVILTSRSGIRPDSHTTIIETECADLKKEWKLRLGLDDERTLRDQRGAASHKNRPSLLDLALNLWEEVFCYPDSCRSTWLEGAVAEGSQRLSSERFDAIISSFGPPTSHLIGAKLKELTGVPWLADFQDLWTQNPYYHFSSVRRLIERKLEVNTLAMADALVTVTEPFATSLKNLHKGKKVACIPFGFDPDDLNPGTPVTEQFTITHTGGLYKGKRDPHSLFKATRDLIEQGVINASDVRIDFYGHDEGWLGREIRENNMAELARIHGLVSRDKALSCQRRSQLLLLLTWNDPREKAVCPGKLYDYLASQRPILSIGVGGGVLEATMNRTNAGIHCTTPRDVADALQRLYEEYKSKGTIEFRGNLDEIRHFSQVESARLFSRILDEIRLPDK